MRSIKVFNHHRLVYIRLVYLVTLGVGVILLGYMQQRSGDFLLRSGEGEYDVYDDRMGEYYNGTPDYYDDEELKWTPDPNFIYIEPANITQRDLNHRYLRKPLIPNIIHQMWDTYSVPNVYIPWIQKTLAAHPDWQYWFWVQGDMECYLRQKHAQYYNVYVNYSSTIFRSDFMRYFILYDYGGLYFDLDVEVLRPMDAWRFISPSIISHETYEHFFFLYHNQREYPNLINTILMTAPGHKFYRLIQQHLEPYQRKFYKDVLRATGPLFIDDILQLYIHKENITHWTVIGSQDGNVKSRRNSSLNSKGGINNALNISEKETSAAYISEFLSTNITVIEPQHWLSTYDPIRTNDLQRDCILFHSDLDNFPSITHPRFKPLRREICDKQLRQNFTNTLNPKAYLDHHWVHSYAKNHTIFFMHNVTDVRLIIPNFISVTERLGLRCS